jgi:hypothetical protein
MPKPFEVHRVVLLGNICEIFVYLFVSEIRNNLLPAMFTCTSRTNNAFVGIVVLVIIVASTTTIELDIKLVDTTYGIEVGYTIHTYMTPKCSANEVSDDDRTNEATS